VEFGIALASNFEAWKTVKRANELGFTVFIRLSSTIGFKSTLPRDSEHQAVSGS
jgi:hypothetical protein